MASMGCRCWLCHFDLVQYSIVADLHAKKVLLHGYVEKTARASFAFKDNCILGLLWNVHDLYLDNCLFSDYCLLTDEAGIRCDIRWAHFHGIFC